eukprot:351658_1
MARQSNTRGDKHTESIENEALEGATGGVLYITRHTATIHSTKAGVFHIKHENVIAYCMERKNMEQKENDLRLTFDDKQLDLGIWTYMKQNMGYEKADELKKDKKNIIPLGYKPDLRLLGIPVLFVSAPNMSKETDVHRMLNTNENHNNDTQSAMDVEEYKNENTTNTHGMRPPPLLEPTSHPLVDQTNRYGFHGQANRYHNIQQHGSQRGRYYRGYHGHINRHRNPQRARTRSRSRSRSR